MKKTTTTQITPQLLTPSPELEELQHLMPMSREDRKALTTDIQKNGIRDAIKVYQNKDGEFFIIGGKNRWEISLELSLSDVTIDIYEGTTAEIKSLVIDDNLNRRHLTPSQKRTIAGEILKLTPKKSNRQIAKKAGVDHKTVGKEREKLEVSGEIEKVETVTTANGRERTRDVKKKVTPPVSKKSLDDMPIKEAEKRVDEMMKNTTLKQHKKLCPHCGGEI